MLKTPKGYFLIAFGILVTLNLWLLSKDSFSQSPYRLLSQTAALVGFVLMTDNLLLSIKTSFLEKLFGGLDKVYLLHRLIGSIAFVLIMNHPILLIIEALPFTSQATTYILPQTTLSYNLGIYAIYTMVLAFIFLLFIKLPYNIWIYSHKLLGVSYILGGLHLLLIPSDVASFLPLRIWVIVHFTIGAMAFIWTEFLYKSLGPKYLYEVIDVKRALDTLNFILKPITKRIFFKPGQFVYVSINSKKIKKEPHPFSIASAPGEENIRISAKILGDYTLTLPNLQVGDKVTLFGPYGSFSDAFLKDTSQNIIWIAGGIGVTPFLSILRDSYLAKPSKNVRFFYCFKGEEGIFHKEIESFCREIPGFDYIPWNTSFQKRLNVNSIKETVGEIKNTLVQICGPVPMMIDLKRQFIKEGVPEENILFENFQFL